ncbi:MAG: hypothetical protein BV459_05680 [Thermoplasmata archaeon M11B2D]|nr:MAG: hypothetical protein BV459_05680 [Thermoplasmata archaeon M11B2D]
MKRVLGGNDFDHTLGLIRECAKTSAKRTVTSHLMVKYYQQFGQIDILPVGVNTDLFKPVEDKAALRRKYGIPENRKVGFWCGTTHPMKGFDKLVQYKNDNPDINWVIVWKQKGQDGNLPGAHNYTHVDQQKLSELMACSDFILCCGLLQPFFMVEWEAMACNLPVIVLDSIEKDFAPSTNPRDDVFRLGWDRKTALQTWKKYIGA